MDILTNKKYKSFRKLSRYQLSPIYWHTLDETYTQGAVYQLYDDTPYQNHTVKYGETLDMLSLFYYQNPVYYWIIADFNRIQNPFDPLEIGTVLKIPSFSDIEFNT